MVTGWGRELCKRFHRAFQQGVEIAGGLHARVLFLEAEGGQVAGDFGGLVGRFLDFDERAAPGVAGLGLAQEQGGVAQDAGQGVVEIQRDGARQLQRAIQFLPLGGGGLRRRRAGGATRRGRGAAPAP